MSTFTTSVPEMINVLHEHFTKQIKRDVCGAPKDLDCDCKNKCIKAMEMSQYGLHHAAVKKFVKYLCLIGHWEFLVDLVENSDIKIGKGNSSDILKDIAIFSESPFGSKHPFLYYAFKKRHSKEQVEFATAKLLCKGMSLRQLSMRHRRVLGDAQSQQWANNPKEHERAITLKMIGYLKQKYSENKVKDIFKQMNWREDDIAKLEASSKSSNASETQSESSAPEHSVINETEPMDPACDNSTYSDDMQNATEQLLPKTNSITAETSPAV